MTWWSNWGPLWRNGKFRALCPLMTQWGNWKPLKKQWGNCGELSGLMRKTGKYGPWWRNATFIWTLWWRNGQIRDSSDDEMGRPDDLIGKLGAVDHWFFSNGLIRLHCILSNSWAPNSNWDILDVMQAEKEYMGPKFSIVPLILQRLCDDNKCLILVFSVIYLDSWGYIGWGPRPGIWTVSFSLFFFFSILHFPFLFVSLSGAPLAPGPLDIVHPCHPVATPLLRNR